MEQKEKWLEKRNQQSISELWDNLKWSTIHVIIVPKGKEREQETEKNVWKNNDWNYSKFVEKHKHPDPRNLINPNFKKNVETVPRYFIINDSFSDNLYLAFKWEQP